MCTSSHVALYHACKYVHMCMYVCVFAFLLFVYSYVSTYVFVSILSLLSCSLASLECVSDVQEVSDWILEADFWKEQSMVVLVTAHNNIVIWDWVKKSPLTSFECEIQCILYPLSHVLWYVLLYTV